MTVYEFYDSIIFVRFSNSVEFVNVINDFFFRYSHVT